MLYKAVSFFILTLFSCFFCNAQESQTILHTDNDKAKQLFFKALDMQRGRRFDLAMQSLEEALKKDEKFEEAYNLLIKDYEMFGFKEKLKKLYDQIIKYLPESQLAAKGYLNMAEIQFENNDLNAAEENVEKSARLNQKDIALKVKALQLLQNVKFVKGEAGKIPENLELEPLNAELNKFQLQYFPAMTADENFLIFTARQGTHDMYDENIYVSKKQNQKWGSPQPISPLINSRENEGTSSINADARFLVFTKCGSPEGQGSCDIFMAERVGNNWMSPKPITAINSPYWDSHPSISADGRRIFFTSARPGGQGKMDLWCAEKDTNSKWQVPYNLGPEINTPFDEETPFLHANGQTLYFASDGHPGFGKIDLFYTVKSGKSWEKPKNLGKVINTNKDESGLFITASGKTGLFCMEDRRERELLSSEIRMFRIPSSFKNGPSCTFLAGTIFDAVTKQRIQANIELVNRETGKVEFSIEADKEFGTYTAVIQQATKYAMFVSRPGYLFQSFVLDMDSISNPEVGLKKDVYLEPIRKGASIVLNNLFFESGKSDLLPASILELRKVGRLMSLNPVMQIEISGHTDNIGKDADNQILSQKRASAVIENLAKQGIVKTRMKAIGLGETKPLNDNSDEDKRLINRRIEFKVL
jgi:outer membrane protein OmpA-like peptidoglycan-associated protein